MNRQALFSIRIYAVFSRFSTSFHKRARFPGLRRTWAACSARSTMRRSCSNVRGQTRAMAWASGLGVGVIVQLHYYDAGKRGIGWLPDVTLSYRSNPAGDERMVELEQFTPPMWLRPHFPTGGAVACSGNSPRPPFLSEFENLHQV